MVILIGVLWGLNWPAVKFMLTELPPITLRATAFPCAALLLAIIAHGLGHRLCPPRAEFLPMLVVGLFVVFGFNVGVTFGQVLTQTSKAAIIAYTMPAITAVLAVVFLRDRLHWRLVLALGIGMAGLAVLASKDWAALLRDPTGPLITLGAALSWAIGNIALKARTWTLSPLAMAMWFFAISTVLAWPLVLIFEPLSGQHWPSLPVIATLAYHILGPMVVCYLLWTVLLGRLPATVAAISTLTAPIVGVSSAVVMLGDPLTWQIVVALALIVGSIFLTLAKPTRARPTLTRPTHSPPKPR
jgi:drug/metabolite transporter (DMT)-like permease